MFGPIFKMIFRMLLDALRRRHESPYHGAGSEEDAICPMTSKGVAKKTSLLLLLHLGACVGAWGLVVVPYGKAPLWWPLLIWVLLAGSLMAIAVLGAVTIWWKHLARFTTVFFTLTQGVAVGILSGVFDAPYQKAGVLTLAILPVAVLGGLLLFQTFTGGRNGGQVVTGVVATLLGGAIGYLTVIALHLIGVPINFHGRRDWGLFESLSPIVIVPAAVGLTSSYGRVRRGIEVGAPRDMEWYAAFSLLLTLVWFYIGFFGVLLSAIAKQWLWGKDDRGRSTKRGFRIIR